MASELPRSVSPELSSEVVSFTPQPEQALKELSMIPVALRTRGNYHELHEFVHRLESLSIPVWIDEIEIPQAASEAGQLECGLRITIFADRAEISG